MTAPVPQGKGDYQSRFQELRSVESRRNALVEVSVRAALSEELLTGCFSVGSSCEVGRSDNTAR